MYSMTVFLFFLGMAPGLIFAGKKGKSMLLKTKVADLLSKMTLEEKVGQMTQVTIDVVADHQRNPGGWQKLDTTRLREAIITYHVGSILNVMGSAYSLENWHAIINEIQDVATKETRLGIPVIYGIDAIHGANYTTGATLFPQSIGMAATWNPDLVKEEATITAYEVRASGIPWDFNPVLGAGRQPLWSRLWETYGEDAYLASTMARAYIKGLQGDDNNVSREDKVAACIKHYLGYSFPFTGKDRTPAYIPERMLREHFLPIFKAGVDAG
ncbi:MAG: beta-glucosidase, partial [Calditrichaeota bacterium]